MLLTKAVCAARASSSVWMAGDTRPAANVRIWWIGKRGIGSPRWATRPSVGGVGWPPSVAGHPGGTSMPLTNPQYAATSVGPTTTGSRGRVLCAMCRLRQTRWP